MTSSTANATSYVEELWGSFYGTMDGNGTVGFSLNMNSQRAARRQALRDCQNAGVTGCSHLVDFTVCGAVSVSNDPPTLGSGSGQTARQARSNAIASCRQRGLASNCEIAVVRCNDY